MPTFTGLHEATVTKENWERMEKGLDPIPEKKPEPRKEPEFPKVEGQIHLKNVDVKKLYRIERILRVNHRNKEGQIFVGFNIQISTKDKNSISGWISESDLGKILPYVKDETDESILSSIS